VKQKLEIAFVIATGCTFLIAIAWRLGWLVGLE